MTISELDIKTGVLSITFSDDIDVTPMTNVIASKIHIRESSTYTGGVTLTESELGTTVDSKTISFTLTASHFATVKELTTPELTIEPGAVRDTAGNLIVGTLDISTAFFVDAFDVLVEKGIPHGIAFSADGTKIFVISAALLINEYNLSSPWDASTATFVDATSVGAQNVYPTGIAFSADGTKMFIVDNQENNINEYNLSSPWDASTATFVDAFDVSAQDTASQDMAFSADGTKMFMVGNQKDNINEYNLSSPWDASTATFVDAFDVSAQDSSPTDIAFSADGTKMFMVGATRANINEYNLSSPWDASTATFVDAFDVSAQDSTPTDIVFSADGTKMFMVGSQKNNINEYTLSSVYPIRIENNDSFGSEFGLMVTGPTTNTYVNNSKFADLESFTAVGMAFEHEGQHKVIRIVLTEEPSNPVTIDISIGTLSRGLSEYGYPGHYWDNTALTASPSRLTFNSNNWDTQQPVTITSMVNDYDHPAQAILVLTPSENLRSDGSSSVPGIHVKVANGAVCTTCATAGPPGAVGPPQKESPQLPVITLKGDNYVTIPFGSAWTDPGYTATDSDGNDITGDVTVFGGVDTSQEGIHIIVYTVMSISGGVAQEIRTVTVEAPPLLNPEPQVNTQPATQAETQIAEQTYCRDMSIDQLVATGDYNVMDNRNGTYGDTIKGTAGADLIIASDSGNKIFGKKGDDCIIGGAGADVIRGQQGNDWIMGLAGVDNLRGGAGHDLLFGGDGDDTILGKAGDDVMVCGAGTDKARGGAGHDIAESCEDVQAEYATPGG